MHSRAIGLPYTKQRLPDVNGRHRRSTHLPSSPRHREGRLHARHEGQLDHFSDCACIRPEVPTGTDLGTILQHGVLRHRDIYQRAYQEEEAGGFEEKALR